MRWTRTDQPAKEIRETTRAHFDTERNLFSQGIKVLSQFFIDEVAKYRTYDGDEEDGQSGEYARIAEDLDTSAEVVVYAKLPRGFAIPTPVGDYNPDWAIAFDSGKVKHVFFIAETKGSMSSLRLREIEKARIECARKFFTKITSEQIHYDVVVPIRVAMKAMRHSEERLTTAVYTDQSMLPVAASVTGLPALQSGKLSGGLSGEHSGKCALSRNTTTHNATAEFSDSPTEPAKNKRVSHAMTHPDTKKGSSLEAASKLENGSGGRDRTYDLFHRTLYGSKAKWPTEQPLNTLSVHPRASCLAFCSVIPA
nr:hypothetical protein [Luteolibacter marinus]